MPTVIQVKRGTASSWTSADTVLAAGEIGFESDTKKMKVGDGSTAWTSLAYTSTDGDITAVVAGTGLSGGATSGSATLTNSMATEIAAKGDLIIGTGSATFDNLTVGANGTVLTADSTVSPTGLKWATPTGGASYTAWTSYTPTWGSVGTSFSLGNGSSTGAYTRVGDLVYARTRLVWGSTTSLVGSYYMLTSFPSGLTNRESNSGIPFVGFTWYYDVSTAAEARGPITQHSSTQARCYYWKSDTTNLSTSGFTETTPWVPATGDEINAWFVYPTDAA